jgi:hypothetical protein
MCKGAHLTHKRSGAQAQEKKLNPQIQKRKIKELKEFKENGREENNQINAKKKSKLTRRNKLN